MVKRNADAQALGEALHPRAAGLVVKLWVILDMGPRSLTEVRGGFWVQLASICLSGFWAKPLFC